jgi:hypothetical protein
MLAGGEKSSLFRTDYPDARLYLGQIAFRK